MPSPPDESLILTGPRRGLALISNTYIETDLKIGDHQGWKDTELSKGMLVIRGMENRSLQRCELESCSLDTRLSTVDVMYGVIKRAVEATISVEVLAGEFYGQITACTTGIQKSLVLHDSEVDGPTTGDGKRAIQLSRYIVAVWLKEILSVTITVVAETGVRKPEATIDFAPRTNGGDKAEITIGNIKMLVKVSWSIIDF
ncbi:hypothetical protein EJB05_34433, partial [Eragrostis curvula]